jgi:hypothetical protein
MKKTLEHDYLKAAAAAVERQVLESPFLGIPADPDVAEFMGAFEEGALSLDDILDSDSED